MKKLIVALATLLPLISFSQDIAPDPIILLLAQPKKYHPDEPEIFESCWQKDGSFIHDNCEMEVRECSIEESFVTKPLLDLKVYPNNARILPFSTDLSVSVPGIYEWNNNVQTYGTTPWRTLPRAPEGAIATIYEGTNSNVFNIYGRIKIPSSGELRLTGPLLAHQNVSLEMGEGWPIRTNIKAEIFGRYFETGWPSKPIKFKLAEGDYQITVRADHNERNYEHRISIKVGKNSNRDINLIINFDQLKDVTNNRNSYSRLGWDEDKLGYHDSGAIGYGFEKVSSVELVDNKSNITNFFKLKDSKLFLKNKPAFEKAIQGLPIYKVKISGTCGTYYKKSKLGEYEVSSSPNGNIVGKLSIFTLANNIDKTKIEYRDKLSQKVFPFLPNLKSESEEVFHQAISKKDSFANLGEGPWGAEGWAQIPSFSLFGKDIFYFNNKENESTQFFKSKSGAFYKRNVSDFSPYKDDVFEGTTLDADLSELVNEKGFIKRIVKERVSEERNTDNIPALVDLTDSKISVRGPSPISLVGVYEAPDLYSKKLGEIKYSNLKGDLKGTFIPFGGKEISLKSDYFEGRCDGNFNHFALQNVLEIYNDFSKIGKGPWGEFGWVRARRYKINDQRFPLKLRLSESENIDSIYYSQDKFQLSLSWEYGNSFRTLSLKDVFDAGKLKLVPNCLARKELNLARFKEPQYVYLGPAIESEGDFTPQQTINIFEGADLNSKKIGEIIFKDEELFFKSISGKEDKIKPALHSGYCDSLKKRLYVHQVWSNKKEWSDLGKGFWGEHGWVNIGPLPIINSELKFKFNEIYSDVKLSRGPNNEIMMTQSYDLAKDENKYIELEDLISPDGMIKIPVNCDLNGC